MGKLKKKKSPRIIREERKNIYFGFLYGFLLYTLQLYTRLRERDEHCFTSLLLFVAFLYDKHITFTHMIPPFSSFIYFIIH